MAKWPGMMLTVALLVTAGTARAELVDRVAAVVNDQIIPLSEVETRAANELMRINQTERDPQQRGKLRNQVMRQALDQLIGEKLLEAEVREAHLDVSDAQIDAAIAEVKKNNGLNDDQFVQVLHQQGYTEKSYREFMRKQVAQLELLRAKVQPKVKIGDQDLKAAYAKLEASSDNVEVHVRHILVAVPAHASPAQVETARKKAEGIAQEARRPGVDFGELARKKSDGSSAADGGDLGFFGKGTMEPEFEEVAFALKPGQISDPVRTQFGWHVLKLIDRRAAGMKSFEEMKPELREKLGQQQMEKLTNQYVQQLRQNALVEIKI